MVEGLRVLDIGEMPGGSDLFITPVGDEASNATIALGRGAGVIGGVLQAVRYCIFNQSGCLRNPKR